MRKSGVPERLFDCGSQPVDSQLAQAEEVQVPGCPVYISPGDERRATGQSEPIGLRKASDDRGNLLLKTSQHTSSTPRWSRNHPAQASRTYGDKVRS